MNIGRLFQILHPLNLIEYFLEFVCACSLWILSEDRYYGHVNNDLT